MFTMTTNKRALLALLLLVAVAATSDAVRLSFGRQTVTVIVTEIAAPRSCREKRSLLNGPKTRSDERAFPGKFCGLIRTDHGSFDLPQTKRLTLFYSSRERLFDALSASCPFRLTVAGSGPDLSPGVATSAAGNKTLIRVEPAGNCMKTITE